MLETAAMDGAAVRVTVARSLEELEPLRDAWSRLQGVQINTDPDYFLTVLASNPDAVRPHIVLLERDGEAQAMLIARIEDVRLSCRLGYRAVYSPRVRALTVVNGGFLGEHTRANADALLAELRRSLAGGEADVAQLRNLLVGSPLHVAATTAPPFLARQHLSTPLVRRHLRIRSSLDEFLQSRSSSTRQSVRRYGRKLEKEFGDRLSLEVFRDESEIGRFFAAADEIGRKTYQHGLGVALADDPVARRLAELAARRGWFRAYVLSIDGLPAAFWYGHRYRGVFATGVPGYDPAYAHLHTGTFVLMRLIDDLSGDGETEILDFGSGDAEYKRRFGDESRREEDVLVWAATAKGIRTNLTRTGVLGLIAGAKRAARSRRLGGALKNRWRARLRSGA
jgi:CelD/BcsL family acetyltransferase involved in cellulose biosynthesis